MTQSTRPRTLHQLMANVAGMPMTRRELELWKRKPTDRDSTLEKGLRAALRKAPDRPLDEKESRGLLAKRKAVAARSLVEPHRLENGPITFHVHDKTKGPHDSKRVTEAPTMERLVTYYQHAIRRFERWSAKAERLGLDKGRPPAHIARYAVDVATMAQTEGGA